MKKRVTHDFETQSACDLRACGAYIYSIHPSTKPTCLAFKVHGESKVYLLDYKTINTPWKKLPAEFRQKWQRYISKGWLFVAQNAFFELCIYRNIMVKRLGWPEIPLHRYRCTAAKAAACALPRNLEGAGEALNLTTQKDKRGYVAMMLTCKPTKQWNAWTKAREEVKAGKRVGPKKQQLAKSPEPPKFITPESHPEVFEVLYRYCKIDVKTEELLDDALPDLIPQEQEIWFLNQKLNWRGLHVDIPSITKIVSMMGTESKAQLEELDSLTMGLVTKAGARDSIMEFLALEGVEIPNMQSKTIEDKIKEGTLSPDMKRLLELRQALSKASTKKYYAFLNRAGKDNRVRDILMYHAASTGRSGGTGINPYNFPRGLIKVDKNRPYAHIQNIIDCDIDLLKVLYGDNLSILFSAVLRNMIIPSPGFEFFVADFSKVEVAVCWWLTRNMSGLKVLKSGKDPYIYQAAANTGKTYEEIERAYNAGEQWAIDARQLGKAQVLGCQFGMGKDKFQSSAWDMYRLKLTDIQSKDAVTSYREANARVPKGWKEVEQAAIIAIEERKKVRACRCLFFVENGFLWIQLPSGRRLAYRKPRITMRETDYGPRKTIEFWGLDKSKKKLQLERTWGGVIMENITQATARDLMLPAMLRLENAGYRALLEVYDEGICEREIGEGSTDEFNKILCERPAWGDDDLVIEASAWTGPRYKKG